MLYHLMLLPVKLINLFDQSRIMDMEMVPLALGLCSDPLLYSLLLSRLCGGHFLSSSRNPRYFRYRSLHLVHATSRPCPSRVQGPVWCPRIYAASVSDAMWLTQVCVCVFVRVCDEGAEMRCCQVGHPIRAVEWRVERSMSLLPISASTSLPVTQLILLASSFSLTALQTLLSHGMLPLAAVSASRSPTTNNSPKVSH